MRVELTRLVARLFSRQLPSPVGLSFHYELRWQESNLRVTRLTDARILPTVAPPQSSRRSWIRTNDLRFPKPAELPNFPIRRMHERPAGIEPAHPPWQGSRLPLHHGRLLRSHFNCQRTESTGPDSNRRRRITGAESWPLDDQCFVVSGTGGIRTLTCLVKSQVCCR